jgi:hypothetical protein
MHPHTLAAPPPPQVCGALHEPQVIMPPQPSGAVPQFWPEGQAVAVWHLHTFDTQAFGAPQVAGPQTIMLPQPSEMLPQLAPVGQALTVGVQPHTLGVPPPPHVCGDVQAEPQL